MKEFRVLMVDDEEDFVRTLSERVSLRGIDADVALDGEEALSMLAGEVPDVMILDLKMPGIGGMEVLRRVKKAYPQVQVIILTGHGTDKDGEEAKRLGAFAYLQKPVELERLVGTMKDAYKKKTEDAIVATTFAE